MAEAAEFVNLGFTPERYPPGLHLCHMYIDEVDRRSVIYPFVRAGLQENEDVAYFADALATELPERATDEATVKSLSREQLSRLRITSVEDAYFPTGVFLPDEMLETLRQLYKQSVDDGASGCRASGEMSWALRDVPGAESVIHYESDINTLVRSTPITAMCQYDTERFDGCRLFEVFSVHPLMVISGQVVRNPCYVEPQEYNRDGLRPTSVSEEDVLARLSVVQLATTCLPDGKRIAEFLHCALLQVPGVSDVRFCLAGSVIPPEERLESIAHRCARSVTTPNTFDVLAVEEETGASVFVLRTISRLFGVIVVDVTDERAFAPYRDVLANVANAVSLTLDARHSQSETRAQAERIASLERRLWRIAREFEATGMLSNVATVADPSSMPGVDELSPRQWEVLTRLLHGERVPRIADELFLSQSTVRNHLADMFKKMGVHSQEELLDLFRTNKSHS